MHQLMQMTVFVSLLSQVLTNKHLEKFDFYLFHVLYQNFDCKIMLIPECIPKMTSQRQLTQQYSAEYLMSQSVLRNNMPGLVFCSFPGFVVAAAANLTMHLQNAGQNSLHMSQVVPVRLQLQADLTSQLTVLLSSPAVAGDGRDDAALLLAPLTASV